MLRLVIIILGGIFLLCQNADAQRRATPQRRTILSPKAKTSAPAQKPGAAKPEAAKPAAVKPDTLKPAAAVKTDTARSAANAVADTLQAESNQPSSDTLTEAEADARAAKVEKSQADSIHSFRITIEDISYLNVCPGTTITIPFRTEGPFDEGNTFIAQIIDATGKTVPISLPVKKSPIKAVIPSYKIGGEVYRIQIVASIPVVRSQEVPLRLLQLPTARIDFVDGTQTARIMPGQEAHLRVNLSGAAPWSFRMSDSTTIYQTISNPHIITVKPNEVKAYKVTGVSNACGSGTVSGEAIVNVNNNPEPKLELKEPDKIARLCSGVPFQVPFNATGKFKEGNKFTVQVAERTGAFKSISQPDSSVLMNAEIPASYKPGEYKLRVVSSAPYLVSQTTNITIVSPTTATLQRDSLRLGENESGELTVRFTGGGPWFVLLSDGTYENNIQETPYKIKVKPVFDTQYQITSAGGLCGVGKFSGSARITVKMPPASITMEKMSQAMVCAGSTIEIPYKIEGRYNGNNKFTVQMTDKSGRFVTLPTTVSPTAMSVKIPASAAGDSTSTQKIRIISSSPAVSSVIEELQVVSPDKAVGEVSGRANITAGRSTRIQLRFKNGLPPWSFTLSDGTAINGTFLNPYLISVSPAATTEYTISSLKSGCGSGTGRGSAVVTVEK